MKKILITGPESSGKSFLAKALATHFNGRLVAEYAREYLSKRPTYKQEDLAFIASNQYNREHLAQSATANYVFCDTGIEVIKIWSHEKYQSVSPLIVDLYQKSNYDLVLLCKPNIPWEPDVLRENPTDRDRLFRIYHSELKAKYPEMVIIDAPINHRINQAIQFILDLDKGLG
tara:strand:- start:3337 stop:3855 length:519 start_codon:yes stop_codon:yes gene_type:complete